MSRQYHGRRSFHLAETPWERAEREEQRFRRRHDRLHRMHLRYPDETDEPDAYRDASADALDDDKDNEGW
jgi:hypothetical protein